MTSLSELDVKNQSCQNAAVSESVGSASWFMSENITLIIVNVFHQHKTVLMFCLDFSGCEKLPDEGLVSFCAEHQQMRRSLCCFLFPSLCLFLAACLSLVSPSHRPPFVSMQKLKFLPASAHSNTHRHTHMHSFAQQQ